MPLNPQQEQVANHFAGRALTIAGPGSGKTSTITARVGNLMDRGVSPRQILQITFTNRAAEEMRERCAKSFGEEAAKQVYISTFHALCANMLRVMGVVIGYDKNITLCDSNDQIGLLMQVGRQHEVEIKRQRARLLATICNDWRENLETTADLSQKVDEGYLLEVEEAIILDYVARLKKANMVDFSGLLSEAITLLNSDQKLPDQDVTPRQKLINRFRFIQVDEYQDTNLAQNRIVELLAGEEDNVMAVGDGDQSIYGWRGANPEAIDNYISIGLSKNGCQVFKLGQNYRSTPQIVKLADTLIQHTPNRLAIDFSTDNPGGEDPKLRKMRNPEEEAAIVAHSIRQEIERGTPAKEIAVFYRLNDMSRAIEQSLSGLGIPYTVVSGLSFYDRREIKDTMCFLKFLCNPKDGIAFHRVASSIADGLGDVAIGMIESSADRHEVDIPTLLAAPENVQVEANGRIKSLSRAQLAACHNLSSVFSFDRQGKNVADLLVEVLDRSSYREKLRKYCQEKESSKEFDERNRNLDELINSISIYCDENPSATLESYLHTVSLHTSTEKTSGEDNVSLMSLHASKGLEFDAVYMIGVEDGILPHRRAVEERPEIGLAEERRLCYVGFTRARKRLNVSWCAERMKNYRQGSQFCRPSQFLLESGLMTEDQFQNVRRY